MRRLRRSPNRTESGASLVEFAIVLPLLIVLLFGIVEFGWAFAQNLDVKHVAREVGRLAAVNAPDSEIQDRTCGSDIANITGASVTTTGSAGDPATITVTADLEQITGLFGPFLGGVGALTSTVDVRLEQDLDWSGTACP